MAAPQPTLLDLPGKFVKRPKEVSLNSRYLIINLLFNVFGERPPRNTKKGKLPSVDAAALSAMVHPFAMRLARWRSAKKAMQSLQNAASFVKPATDFTPGPFTPVGQDRAVFRFVTVGYDNVERAFTQAKVSIPLNLDKSGRRAFITPTPTLPTINIAHNQPLVTLIAKLATVKVDHPAAMDLNALAAQAAGDD